MSQHDYNLIDQPGAQFRADLNNALLAAVSNNSGVIEPNPTFAYQFWADTTTGLLKQRNAANSAWVTIGNMASVNLGLQPYDVDTAKTDVAQVFTAVQTPKTGTASVSTTSDFVYNPSTHGQVCTITLTNAITVTIRVSAGTIVAGTHYTLRFKAGDTSARTFAFNTTEVNAPAQALPIILGSTVTNARDVFHLVGVDSNTVEIVGSAANVY